MQHQVEYSRELGPPIMTIDEARKAGAFHEIPPLPGANSNLPEVPAPGSTECSVC